MPDTNFTKLIKGARANYFYHSPYEIFFKTNSKEIVIECKRYFGFRDVDELITQRKRAFLAAFNANDNSICNVCKHVADRI